MSEIEITATDTSSIRDMPDNELLMLVLYMWALRPFTSVFDQTEKRWNINDADQRTLFSVPHEGVADAWVARLNQVPVPHEKNSI